MKPPDHCGVGVVTVSPPHLPTRTRTELEEKLVSESTPRGQTAQRSPKRLRDALRRLELQMIAQPSHQWNPCQCERMVEKRRVMGRAGADPEAALL